MRQTIVGLAVALAAAVSAAPASACGYAGCGSPGWNYNYSGFYGNYSTPVAPCGFSCGGYGAAWGYGYYGRLPYPTQPYATLPQYYWVNQGPTYTGPGLFAPVPTYQERAVSGWYGYGPTAYGTTNYSYGGNATPAYADQTEEDVPAPVYRPYHVRPMYHYARPYRRVLAPRYYPSVRYGYAPRFRRHVGVGRYTLPPRYMAHRYAPRFIAPRYARPRMSLRYGVPHMVVRRGYAPLVGYVPMPPRRMYRPMPN